MLPFPNRKGRHDEVLELADEDLILVEASPLAPETLASIRQSVANIEAEPAPSFPLSEIEVIFTPLDIEQPQPSPSPPESVVVPISRSARPSTPRLVWDADAENDVADECLASIAVETSKTRLSDPFLFSTVAPPPRRERKDLSLVPMSSPIPPPAPSSVVGVKVPKPSPPPMRTSPFERRDDKAIWARKSGTNEVEDRTSLPSVFTRKTPFQPMPVAANVATVSSMPPPVVMPTEHARDDRKNEPPKNEPTVILLRERPRGVWVFGSAAIGALCAVTAMHFVGPLASPQSPPPPTVVAVPAPPPTTVVAPPPTATTTPEAKTEAKVEAKPIPTVTLKPSQPAVVSFSDDQGVAIAPPPAPAPKPAPKPKAAKANVPMMVPDTATAKLPEPPPAPAPKPKKPLTPEQQLSEAQLKASLMK